MYLKGERLFSHPIFFAKSQIVNVERTLKNNRHEKNASLLSGFRNNFLTIYRINRIHSVCIELSGLQPHLGCGKPGATTYVPEQ